MADIVGLDIVAGIANNLYGALPDDPFRSVLQPPEVIQKLVVAGRLGDKTHGGFYKREGKTILALDFVLGEYRSRNDVRIDEVERLLARPFAERLLAFEENSAEPWARFVIAVLDSLDRYVEYVGPVVASDVLSVDNVMRWGFQWEMGPYEMNDLRTGEQRSYRTRNEQRYARSFGLQEMLPIASSPEYLTLAERKTCSGTVFEDEAGALIDLGEGVACLEFRTKMNTFSPALCAVVNRARDMAERDFAALVIGGDGPHFSAGYNLKVLLDAAIAEDWAALAAMLREVQTTFQRLKYSTVPIVAAVRGYTLGAGFECAIHCSAIQAGPELVMGMPEMLVGLVPAGGGIKETLARAMDELKCQTDAIDGVEFAFRKIVLSGKSGSAHEARKMGLIRQSDGISRNADRLLFDAKSRALALAGAEYRPPEQKAIQVLGEPAWERLAMLVEEQHRAGVFTQYDKDIALKVAGVLTHKDFGADTLSEERLLDLERETLITLAHNNETVERMRTLLETGKPLRN